MGWDDSEIGDLVCEILTISLANRKKFDKEAAKLGGTFEGFVAAATVQQIKEYLEKKVKARKPKSRRKVSS